MHRLLNRRLWTLINMCGLPNRLWMSSGFQRFIREPNADSCCDEAESTDDDTGDFPRVEIKGSADFDVDGGRDWGGGCYLRFGGCGTRRYDGCSCGCVARCQRRSCNTKGLTWCACIKVILLVRSCFLAMDDNQPRLR